MLTLKQLVESDLLAPGGGRLTALTAHSPLGYGPEFHLLYVVVCVQTGEEHAEDVATSSDWLGICQAQSQSCWLSQGEGNHPRPCLPHWYTHRLYTPVPDIFNRVSQIKRGHLLFLLVTIERTYKIKWFWHI